jgi:hypothetical protein
VTPSDAAQKSLDQVVDKYLISAIACLATWLRCGRSMAPFLLRVDDPLAVRA